MLARYLFVGGASYAIELGVMYLLLFIGLSSVMSVGVAFWFGLLVAFFLQKAFTFKDSGTSKKRTTLQFALYGALVAFNYVFTLLLVAYSDTIGGAVFGLVKNLPIVGDIESFNLLFTRSLALGITIIWNFLLYRHVIFKQPK